MCCLLHHNNDLYNTTNHEISLRSGHKCTIIIYVLRDVERETSKGARKGHTLELEILEHLEGVIHHGDVADGQQRLGSL